MRPESNLTYGLINMLKKTTNYWRLVTHKKKKEQIFKIQSHPHGILFNPSINKGVKPTKKTVIANPQPPPKKYTYSCKKDCLTQATTLPRKHPRPHMQTHTHPRSCTRVYKATYFLSKKSMKEPDCAYS